MKNFLLKEYLENGSKALDEASEIRYKNFFVHKIQLRFHSSLKHYFFNQISNMGSLN